MKSRDFRRLIETSYRITRELAFIVVPLIAVMFFGVGLNFVSESLFSWLGGGGSSESYIFKNMGSWMTAAVAIIAIVHVVKSIFDVLQGDRTTSSHVDLVQRVSRLEEAKHATLSPEDRNILIGSLRDDAFEKLKESLASESLQKAAADGIFNLLEKCRTRLNEEADRIATRGSFNLAWGVGFSLAALGVLAQTAYFAPDPKGDWQNLALWYAPKLSLAIFIQVFAFFFLKIYRATVVDVRFFHNEITSIELVWSSLLESLRIGDENIQGDIVRAIVLKDRNLPSFSSNDVHNDKSPSSKEIAEVLEKLKSLLSVKSE